MTPASATRPAAASDAARGAIWFGGGLTLAVHVALVFMLASVTGSADLNAVTFPVTRLFCDDMHCAEKPRLMRRRGPDDEAVDLGVIEATVIPRLGLAEPKAHKLPKLVKYEQPEKIEEAVNILKDNPITREIKHKAIKPKKAQLDRRRKKKTLVAILGAPDDDDPRKRAMSLDRIIGDRSGVATGVGTDRLDGNVYAGKVAGAIHQRFTVPPFLSESELKRLKMRIRITRVNEAGQILEYKVIRRSRNKAFNDAAVRAIRQFIPGEGGLAHLPSPDGKTLKYINSKGMLVDLDGALFRK
ncbi:MAG: hypothetical protein GXP54_01995 [Deltaproteobacteria bacterium]|nr:hypothetical protein [Deltaproteobacteria bacterium]